MQIPDRKEQLLARLDDIARGLSATGDGLALIALGSVGLDLHRVDAYSDLDFFAVVRPGAKPRFLADVNWLQSGSPIVYFFRNTPDGFKLLYADRVFAEMAVFEPEELENIPFAAGRVVWSAPGVDPAIATPSAPARHPEEHTNEWRVGEALTNLYVGLGRYLRGEKLSALRFIQGHAVDRVIELAATLEGEQPADPDPFEPTRRFEARFPATAARLADFLQGYQRIPVSAISILRFLEEHFAVNPEMREAILELYHQATDASSSWGA